LTLSVCLSVCLSCPFKLLLLFLFVDGIESFFGRQFSMWHSTKQFSSIFDLCPLKPKIIPQNLHKLPISWFVWQIDWRCLGLPGSFRGWLIQWKHAKCCGVDPYCHGNKIWARHGDPVAYRLVYSTSWQNLPQTLRKLCSLIFSVHYWPLVDGLILFVE